MSKSPEDMLLNQISRRQEIEQRRNRVEEKNHDFQAAYEKAEKLINEERIDMGKFKGFYDANALEEDDRYVKRREKEFNENDSPHEKEMHKYAVIAEAIIHNQIDMNGWLGGTATAVKTSKYDDYKYGVDEYVKFRKTKNSPSANLALGVDVTFGSDLVKKMETIRDHIRRGDLGKIKYLLTKSFRGELSNVPRAVVGFDMKNLQELKELWMNGKKRALAQHPVKFMILGQMKLQLEAFTRYAQKVNQPHIAETIEEVLKIIERISHEELKEYAGDKNGFDFESDRVYRAIKEYCPEINQD